MKPLARPLLVAVATATAALMPLPAEAATEHPVLITPAGEFQPARGPDHLAWEQNTKASPNHYDVFAQADGGGPIRVNAGRSNAAMGGIDDHTLVYQGYRKKKSDLFFYDLNTGQRSKLPKKVNSKQWEYWPSISEPWLLFGRWKMSKDARLLILLNLETGKRRVLNKIRGRDAFIGPGQVNGDYAVWWRCPTKGRCQVYRYQISTGTRVKIPNPGSYQRAPSVNAEGTVFLARGGKGCGGQVRIVKIALDGTETILAQFPEGLDSRDTFAFTDEGGITHVHYERFGCGRKTGSDIYQLMDPEITGSITIVKDAIPNDPTPFEFDPSSNLQTTNFFLADASSGPLPSQETFQELEVPGTYTVQEVSTPSGWELTDIACAGGGTNTTSSIATATATIELDAGEAVVCTFTNTEQGTIIVAKETDPDGFSQSFEFETDYGPNFFLTDGETNDSGDLSPGTYSVSELTPSGWALPTASCSDGSAPSAIALGPGETVTCTFTNSLL
jgi:hypothetical protein